MADTSRQQQLLWAKWQVHEDESLTVIATFAGPSGYVQETSKFTSLAEAAELLGASFNDVVRRAQEVGSHSGRWRP